MQHITNGDLPTGTESFDGRPWILCPWNFCPFRAVPMSPAGLPVDAAKPEMKPAGMPIGHGVPEH